MTTYITQTDKNGKEIYFRVTDGKKTKVSRAEYESNRAQEASTQLVIDEQTEQSAVANEITESDPTFAEIEISGNIPADTEPEYKAEPIPAIPVNGDIETEALMRVQEILEATVNHNSDRLADTYKLTLKITKNFALILYRKCSICGLMYGENGEISKLSFMGTTSEARKKYKATRYDFNGLDDIESRRDEILEQVNFVNEWLNAERSA